ncbi:hypothetical protein VP1G_02822 [Cytospora mali]|uniref:Uncharacterized protein n=1 Tax=Cytospora mali TaxID=578113 RepID=A0A194UUK9_CYTMA|nr:hypothetical protein VP1G_02822 [Valsa mali var. pyri (nom. inval.)]
MTDLASASSHAEQRDIHTSIRKQIVSQDQIQTSLDDLKASVTQMRVEFSSQLVTSLGQVKVEFSQRLSEVQLHQFMDHLSVTFLLDPDKAFQASYCMGKRRRLMSSTSCPEFWLEPKMQIWNRCCESSLIIIKGTRKMRFQLRDFCTDSIATLLDTKVPVIWALKTIATQENTRDHVSTIDLLKYMISQAIRVNKAIQTDATLAPHLGSYLGARTEEEWFNVFASVLQGIPLVYIILDVDVLNLSAEEPTKDVWSTEFLRIFSELQARNSKTVVRVALVDYSSPLLRRSTTTERHDLVVSVGGMRQAKAPTRLPYRRGGASMRGRTLGLGRQAGATQTCHGAGRLKRG